MCRITLEWAMGFAAVGVWKLMPGAGGIASLVLLLACLAAYFYLQRYVLRPSRWDALLAPLTHDPLAHKTFMRAGRGSRRVSNRKLVAAALPRCGACLELSDDSLRDDKALVLAAIANFPRAFRFASPRLKNDRDVALAAVKGAGEIVKELSDMLRDDDEIGSAALRADPQNLRFLSDRLRGDKDFVVNGVANLYPRLQQLGTLPLADAAFFLEFYTDRVPHKLALRQFFPSVEAASVERAEAEARRFRSAVPGIASEYVRNRNPATHQETLAALKSRFPEFGEEVYQQAVSAELVRSRPSS